MYGIYYYPQSGSGFKALSVKSNNNYSTYKECIFDFGSFLSYFSSSRADKNAAPFSRQSIKHKSLLNS